MLFTITVNWNQPDKTPTIVRNRTYQDVINYVVDLYHTAVHETIRSIVIQPAILVALPAAA